MSRMDDHMLLGATDTSFDFSAAAKRSAPNPPAWLPTPVRRLLQYYGKWPLLCVGLGLVSLALFISTIVLAVKHNNHAQARCSPAGPVFHGLAGAMNVDRLVGHLEQLQQIATAHSGTRAVTFGYNASLAYVESQLASGAPYLTLSRQYFDIEFPRVTGTPTLSVQFGSGPPISQLLETDFVTFSYTGYGSVSGPISLATNTACGACCSADFVNITAGSIALIPRSASCPQKNKVLLAIARGAVGALVYNYGDSPDSMGPPHITLMYPTTVPVFGISFGLYRSIRSCTCASTAASLSVQGSIVQTTTMNLLATTKTGDPKQTIVVGSHLDSVDAGPGINDNGSGSSFNLELALNLAAAGALRSRVIFAWWSAEELGLLGSHAYVDALLATNPTALASIALNLNFDMLGSINGFQGVYDGASTTNSLIRSPCTVIQSLFEAFFKANAVPYMLSPFNGRSDYGPFLEVNISAGGLDSGADEIKDMAMRATFGGSVGVPADTCYHQACDNLQNVDPTRLVTLARAAASVLQQLATSNNLHALLYPNGPTDALVDRQETPLAAPAGTTRVAHGAESHAPRRVYRGTSNWRKLQA